MLGAACASAAPTGVVGCDVVERAALGGLVAWFTALWFSRFSRPIAGALVGAFSIQVLLRAEVVSRFGVSALITAAVTALVVISGYRAAGAATQRRIRRIGLTVVAFVVFVVIGTALTLWKSNARMAQGLYFAQAGAESAGVGQQGAATLELIAARDAFRDAHRHHHSPMFALASMVPVLSQHVRVVATASGVGQELTSAALSAVTRTNYDDLRGANGTIKLDRLVAMRAPLRHTIATTQRAIRQINATSSPWLIGSVRHRITHYEAQLSDAIPKAQGALAALNVAPEMLGAHRSQHYLVLFGNPAESRGLGGFIGAWAQLDATNGHLKLVRHGHIDQLNNATEWTHRQLVAPADYRMRYSALQPQRYIQNVSASPDFPTVARVAANLYAQTMGTHVDGVLYSDPIALAHLLALTGSVFPNRSWFRLNDKNAASFLMHDQYLRYPGRTQGRMDLLADAAEATFDALTKRKLPPIGDITSTLAPMSAQGRLVLYSDDPHLEAYLGSVGLTGAFPRPSGGDLLSVRISNASTNKADYYVDQSTHYTVNYDATTGQTSATAQVTYLNHAPSSGEPAYILGNQDSRVGKPSGRPFGSDTLDVSLYSALRPISLRVNGRAVGIQTQRELGFWVGSRTITVPPGGTVTFVMQLRGHLAKRASYRLSVVPQPSARPRHTSVTVQTRNGTTPGRSLRKSFGGDQIGRVNVPSTPRGS